jgi:hypothetical protein
LLFPAGLILERVFSFVQGANERKETVILNRAFGNFTPILVIVVTDAGFVVAAVSDHENQRLATTFRPGAHHFHNLVVFVLVNFVNQHSVGVA